MGTVDTIIGLLLEKRIIPSTELETLRKRWFTPERQGKDDAEQFTKWLVLNKYVTDFQGKMLVQGKTNALQIGSYTTLEIIRTGVMSGTVKVQDPAGKICGMQFVDSSKRLNIKAVQKFKDEAVASMDLHHPNIQGIVEIGIGNRQNFVIRELVEGETLASLMARKGKLPYLQASRIFLSLMAGMSAYQQKNLTCGPLTANQIVLALNKKNPRGPRIVKIMKGGITPQLLSADLEMDENGAVMPSRVMHLDTSPPPVSPPPEEENYKVGALFFKAVTGQDLKDFTHQVATPKVQSYVPEVPEEICSIIELLINPAVDQRPKKIANIAKGLKVLLLSEEDMSAGKEEETFGVSETNVREPMTGGPDVALVRKVAPVARVAAAQDMASEEPATLEQLLKEFQPNYRDLVFIGLGCIGILLVVAFLHILTGWKFINLVCLILGGVISFSVEKLLEWRERKLAGGTEEEATPAAD